MQGGDYIKKIKVTHRSNKEAMKQIKESMLIKANKTTMDERRLKLEDDRCVVWVSIGEPNLWNRINSGMMFSTASVTFEIEEIKVEKPNGKLKRIFGKSQRVIVGDVKLPSDSVFLQCSTRQ